MAIRIIEGPPGSGKTYYAVRHLAHTYFEKQEDGRYELIKPCTLITNIDDFQPEHVSLQDAIQAAGSANIFFTEPYQREFTNRFESQIIYIIDEAQRLFRKGTRVDKELSEVFFYFEYHRHLGHDIYLITQNHKKLPLDLVVLTEYIISSAPRSRSVIGEFKYKWLSDGEVIHREGFKPEQGIFDLYKSMDNPETEKIRNPVMRTVVLVLLTVVVIVVSFFVYIKYKWAPPEQTKQSPPAERNDSEFAVQKSLSTVTDTVVIRVDSYTEYRQVYRSLQPATVIIFAGVAWPKEIFPHPLREYRGSWYATIPKSLLPENEQERSSRPRSEEREARAGSVHASDLSAAAHVPAM